MSCLRRALVLVLLLLADSAPAQIRTFVAQASKDNTLFQDTAGALSNGAGEYFFVGKAGATSVRRGVIAFDMSDLPRSALIVNATLTLHMSRSSNSAAIPTTLQRTLADWGEGTSDAIGEEGAGAPSTEGDATWLHTFYSTDLWTNAGGDFDATISATTTVSLEGDYTWSDPNMASDVWFWNLNRAQNFGWTIRGEEVTGGTAKRFDSRQNSDLAVRPRLTIDYLLHCPWDLTETGMVDLEDLTTLLSHFGVGSGAIWSDGDIDTDGDVDLVDLAQLLAHFGSICPP